MFTGLVIIVTTSLLVSKNPRRSLSKPKFWPSLGPKAAGNIGLSAYRCVHDLLSPTEFIDAHPRLLVSAVEWLT